MDGYDSVTNTVYEFNGCAWHGCTCLKQRDKRTPDGLQTLEEVYQRFLTKRDYIIDQGYDFVAIWECQFKQVINDSLLMVIQTSKLFSSLCRKPGKMLS